MARIRSVHPSLFTDEAWVSCSPLARILYVGLMCDADDQGLFEWKPLQIKMRLLPGDAADVPALLAELVSVNLIAQLSAGGKSLGAIRYFRRFQRPKKPNAVYVLPPEWRTYVGLGGDSSEPIIDEPVVVPNQYPTEPEISQQMEDGGGEVIKDADASFVRPPSPKTRKRPAYPAEFEVAWKAYPHHEGRSSKPDSLAEWLRLPDDERVSLPGCIERFRPNVAKVCGDKGAPCMSRWLKRGQHLNWMPATTEATQPTAWSGPEKVFRAMERAFGPEKARGYLSSYCAWQDLPFEALVVSSPIIADMICKAAMPWFEEIGVRVLLKGKAA